MTEPDESREEPQVLGLKKFQRPQGTLGLFVRGQPAGPTRRRPGAAQAAGPAARRRAGRRTAGAGWRSVLPCWLRAAFPERLGPRGPGRRPPRQPGCHADVAIPALPRLTGHTAPPPKRVLSPMSASSGSSGPSPAWGVAVVRGLARYRKPLAPCRREPARSAPLDKPIRR